MDQKQKEIYTKHALAETNVLLELNPEFNAVWNYRRNILMHLFSTEELIRKDTLNSDLKMVMAQLKMYPKCYWIWNHRTWCLARLQEHNEANWQYELAIVLKLLDLDSRNFHGWHYRRYVVENIERATRGDQNAALAIDLAEFQYTTAKINKNISNFSAWHNRTNLIPKILGQLKQLLSENSLSLAEFGAVIETFSSPHSVLKHELELVKTGMYMDPEDTSVWLYLQWLLTDRLFVEDVKSDYVEILGEKLAEVEELNDLEKNDHPNHDDNIWCLKTIIFLMALINQSTADNKHDDKIHRHLQTLVRLDPLRRGHYTDQLAGIAPLFG